MARTVRILFQPVLQTPYVPSALHDLAISRPWRISSVMDVASTTISIVSSIYKVSTVVTDVKRTIKDAPRQLQSLEDCCKLNKQSLDSLRITNSYTPVPIDISYLGRLSDQAQRNLDKVGSILCKVVKVQSAGVTIGSERAVRPLKYMQHKKSIDRVTREVKELRDTIDSMAIR